MSLSLAADSSALPGLVLLFLGRAERSVVGTLRAVSSTYNGLAVDCFFFLGTSVPCSKSLSSDR